jgi:hypothetical protein
MRTTKSHKNIEKAMELHKLIRQVEKLARRIKPLRAHFRPLLDPDDLVLVAGRLAVVGKQHPRSSIDRDKLRVLITPQQFDDLLLDLSYVEIDVKPVMQLAKDKEQRA